ncbi:MAG: NifU family protein [Dehalococcoidia bacterium]
MGTISAEQIEVILERLRPAVHGVKLREITAEGVVRVTLADTCGGCSLSAATVKAAIERLILEEVPEAKGVEAEEEGPPGG